jgi:hypothetical protein
VASSRERDEYLSSFHEQPDVVVRFLAWLLGALHALFSLPRALLIAALRPTSLGRAGGGMYVNYVYAALWIALLWTLLLVGNWTSARVFAAAAAAVGAWRFLEVTAWWLKLLFDRGHQAFVSPERNVVFLLLDAVAISFSIALALRLDTPASGAATHWVDALAIGTLSGAPGNVHAGPWTEVAVSGGTLAGLLLFAAGLALLVGLIGERLDAERPYSGPMRAPFRAVRGRKPR